MADQVPTEPNTPLLNKHPEDDHTRLPSGPCNYTNLSIGGDAKCGCRRFTELHGGIQPGVCFCEHHSCYHDHNAVDGLQVWSDVPAAGGKSWTPRAPLNRQPSVQQDYDMQDEQAGVGLQIGEPLSDTLHWSRFVKSGSSLGSFPPIPSQCLLPSDDGSKASSSQLGCTKPFGGLGLNTLSRVPKPGNSDAKGQPPRKERQMQICEDSHGNKFLQSLTEIATPSVRSLNIDAGLAFGKNVAKVQQALQRISEERSQGNPVPQPDDDHSLTGSNSGDQSIVAYREDQDEYLLPRIRSILNHVVDHPHKIQNHEQRLDRLENASFAQHPAIDEIQESNGYLEHRVDSLETRVDDLERARIAQSDSGSFVSRHLEGSVDTTSSSALVAAAINRLDYSRIEALEAQVSELQAIAPPSHARPCEFEVVFLPFGPRLNGIWSTCDPATQRSRLNSTAGDDVTQTQPTTPSLAQTLSAHDPGIAWETTMKDIDDYDPLMPRAYGLRHIISERLKSRGLVRSVQISGPDARDVQAGILTAFGELPKTLAEDPFSQHSSDDSAVPKALSNYLGLRVSWVPLRKLHKNDNLRFLDTPEMITPALWTVHFLSSSVAMRAHGTRRLYVTQADAYIQHLRNESAEWTWQKLRQLPRVYSDGQSSIQHTPEADAVEPCWAYDERLDPPVDPTPSLHSSFTSHHSALSIRPSHEQGIEITHLSDHSSASSRNASTTPTSIVPLPGPPFSPLKERSQFRPLHTRTSSMPSLIPTSPSMTKRRIASFELESQSSPTRPIPATLKRRRISRSPSRPRDTPRWSVGPPSPYTFVDDIVERGKRGTTPFAYATPHSNAPYTDGGRHLQDDDDDDEGSVTDEIDEGFDHHALSDSDSEGSGAHQPDDEWEGVQRDESQNTHILSGKAYGLRQDRQEQELNDDEEDDQDDEMRSESEASSSPSEYPSRQPDATFSETKAGFRIHVDEEIEEAH